MVSASGGWKGRLAGNERVVGASSARWAGSASGKSHQSKLSSWVSVRLSVMMSSHFSSCSCRASPGAPREQGERSLEDQGERSQSGAIWNSTFRNWMKTTLPLFKEAGTERCVYVKLQHADGTMVDLDKPCDITLEPGERLIILVMNTDDFLILYTDTARTEVDAFEKLLNQSFEATPRAPVDQYLGMHVTRNRAQRLLSLDGRRHVYDYIHEMVYDPKSTTTVTTPLDPNIVYSLEDCPAEVDVDLRAKCGLPMANSFISPSGPDPTSRTR